MSLYYVSLDGCDDATRFRIELSDEEAAVVFHLEEAIRDASAYGCQPRLNVSLRLERGFEEDYEVTFQ